MREGTVELVRGDINLPGVTYDALADVWTVEGIRFAGFLLRAMSDGSVQVGTPFEFVRSEKGGLELRNHECAGGKVG